MPSILLHLLPASFYAALTLICARARHPETEGSRHVVRGLLAAAILLHLVSLGELLFGDNLSLHFGFASALSLTLWMAMLIYFLESLVTPLHHLLRIAAPAAAITTLLPVLFPGHPQTLELNSWAFKAHVVAALLAYSLFTLAILHALLLAATEKRIHNTHVMEDLTLPPLLTQERILFRLNGTAFVFLTLAVGSGVFFSEQIFGKPLALTHKTVFGIASWSLFGILLAGRHLYGWRGRTATRWMLAGFICLILTYAGTRFVLEVILARSY